MAGGATTVHLPLRVDVRLTQLRIAFLLRALIHTPAQAETPRYGNAQHHNNHNDYYPIHIPERSRCEHPGIECEKETYIYTGMNLMRGGQYRESSKHTD